MSMKNKKGAKHQYRHERRLCLELLEMYRDMPALWDVTSFEYSDRRLKRTCYQKLLKKYREWAPDANLNDLKKKLNSLRWCYKRELKRLESCPEFEEESSSLYYFEAMDFLRKIYCLDKSSPNYLKVINENLDDFADFHQTSDIEDADINEELGEHYDVDFEKSCMYKAIDYVELSPESGNVPEQHNESSEVGITEQLEETKKCLEFIEMYRSMPSLWNMSSDDFYNKDLRNDNYAKLLKKYREWVPGASLDDMKKKISNLRSEYKREVVMLENGDIESPTLCYFDALEFLHSGPYKSARRDNEHDNEIPTKRVKMTTNDEYTTTQDSIYDEDIIEMESPPGDKKDEDNAKDNKSLLTSIKNDTNFDTNVRRFKVKTTIKSIEKRLCLEFIEMYRSMPALWDVSSKNYSNKQIKQENYNKLLQKYREWVPHGSLDDMKNKIACLRSVYRREVKRLEKYKNDKTTLFYFEAMDFLRQKEKEEQKRTENGKNKMPSDIDNTDISFTNTKPKKIYHKKPSISVEKKLCIEFIEMYRSLPSLWDTNSDDYYNRDWKKASYLKLQKKYREWLPNATIEDVKNKIASLRSVYRREVKRLENTGEQHSSLYYFEAMDFLRNKKHEHNEIDADIPKQESMSSMEEGLEDHSIYEEDIIEDNSIENEEQFLHHEQSEKNSMQEHHHKSNEHSPKHESISLIEEDIVEDVYDEDIVEEHPIVSTNVLNEQFIGIDDDIDRVAQTWASKLRKMDKNQQLYAEKFINDILFEGQLGNLHRQSVQILK
ncbi:uncharacterized protein LOC142222354 [Haematobia irritans]|uniref:uncharacterized protein LOC142222354 n=1 Tax=Haematobia irritans TaxID=7368 RepID=UPI003F502FAF